MRNLLDVLREKESDLVRVRQEVEALRFVAPLLFERDDQFRDPSEVLWPETRRTIVGRLKSMSYAKSPRACDARPG